MSQPPPDPPDPAAWLQHVLGGGQGGEPADLAAALRHVADLLSSGTGPVNWTVVDQVAVQAVPADDATPGPAEEAATSAAVRLAELWLDPVTGFPAGATTVAAWTRAQWLDHTRPGWQQLVEPVAARVADSFETLLPAEAAAVAAPVLGMLRQVGGLVFGTSVGQALGSLAGEVLTSTDTGLPLGPAGSAALVPVNVAAFGEGLGVGSDDVRLYLALREAAHHRLFAGAPWLRGHIVGLVERYATGIAVDREAIENAAQSLDPSDPDALQRALTDGMFAPQDTPEQRAALERLETSLALVEGWVDTVVQAAAGERMPSVPALRESMRRRRATGGPGEQAFASLVGLELRPRRLREAAALWVVLTEERGSEGRDAVWAHPDLMPSAADLDDPAGYSGAGVPLDLSGLDDAGEAPPEA